MEERNKRKDGMLRRGKGKKEGRKEGNEERK